MKKIIILTLALVLSMPMSVVFGQSLRELREEVIKKEGKKLQKLAKQKAKEDAKNGIESALGGKTLEEQYYERHILEAMRTNGTTDEDDTEIYLFGTGEYSTDNRGVALKYAKARALQDLQTQLEAVISGELTDDVAIDQGTDGTIQGGGSNTQQTIKGMLKNVNTVIQTIAPKKDKRGFYEATVVVYYNRLKADKLANENRRRKASLSDSETTDRLRQMTDEVYENNSEE